MTDRELRIAIFPFGSDTNPYQKNLKSSLQAAGCDVLSVEPRGRFSGLSQLKSLSVDVIHNDWMTGTYRGRSVGSTLVKSLATLRDLRSIGTPMIWTVHNLAPHELPASAILDRRLEQKLVARMSGFVHFSENSRSEWAIRHPDSGSIPAAVIRHGHFINDYPNEISRQAARDSLEIRRDSTRVILCFGSIREYKGFADFAETFTRLDTTDSLLLIAGAPHSRDEVDRLRAIASSRPDQVRLDARWIPEQDVQRYMNAADCGVGPFRTVTTSGSLSLMQSFGLPVAVPKLGGLPEMATSERSVIYDPGTEEAALGAILALASRVSLDRAAAIEAIRDRDSWHRSAEALCRLYRRIVRSQLAHGPPPARQ